MKKNKVFILMFLILLLTSCGKNPDTIITSDITIKVTAHQTPVVEAVVVLQPIGVKTTDQYGTVIFGGVPEGTYQITVSREGFEDYNNTYQLSGEDQIITIDLKIQPIESPTKVNVIIGDGQLILEWNQVENDYLAGYRIYKSINDDDYDLIFEIDSSVTHYIDDEVDNGIIYYYRIQSVDDFGQISGTFQVAYAIPNPPLSFNLLYSGINISSGTFDIYILQNSKEINLTNTLASEICSDYHSERNQILFVSDETGKEQIYIMDLSGETRKKLTLVSEGAANPRFSPDGTEIIYVNLQDQHIYKMSAEGTNAVILTEGKEPDWSQVKDKILFVAKDSEGVDNIFIMECDGTNKTQLTFYQTSVKNPRWSPDGEKIAYIRSGQVCVIDADGSNEIFLTKLAIGDDLLLDFPGWSPSGDEILYVSNDNEEQIPAIYVRKIDDNSSLVARRIIGYGIIPIAL
ncbi:MAG: PD40 domain-containing protein [Halanaerobiales bacterium]|nr:PD40 domain-containing protein [Halanaerobiales bacterium]